MRVIQQVVGDFSNINLNAKDRCSFIKDIVKALKEKQERNDSLLLRLSRCKPCLAQASLEYGKNICLKSDIYVKISMLVIQYRKVTRYTM